MKTNTSKGPVVGVMALLATCLAAGSTHAAAPVRDAYFGDTHIHTMYSFDAFMGNVRTTPDDAYRYAKGEPIDHHAGMKLRITGAPLDFLMVSDHAKYLGVFAAQLDPESPVYGHPDAQEPGPHGQDQAFRHQLPKKAGPGCPQGRTHGHLGLASFSSGK